MAAQQVVGLIVVETIDVFLDELKRMKFVSEEGIVEEMKLSKNRLSAELAKRFEERQIWSREIAGHRGWRSRRLERDTSDSHFFGIEDAFICLCADS
jgi:hypothetical protein